VEYEARSKLMRLNVQQIERVVNEMEQFLLGLSIDSSARTLSMEGTVTAVAGTTAAQELDQPPKQSAYTGLLLPDAAATLIETVTIHESQVAQFEVMRDAFKGIIEQAIDEEEELPDEASREKVKKLVADAGQLLLDTAQAGTIDLAASLKLDPGDVQLVVGCAIADGEKLEQLVRDCAALVEGDPGFPGINFDADSQHGVAFHTMTVPVPAEEAEAREILGESLEVAIGTAPKSAYLAIGKGGVASLKQAIDRSANQAVTGLPPVKMTASLVPIFEFASSIEENPQVAQVSSALEGLEGRDQVTFTETFTDGVANVRFEIQDGVLAAFGALAAAEDGSDEE
jgi:hypothetical protein